MLCRAAQGVDCFGVFMQSGLPKEVLKAVWDLVAGDAGQLSRHQFVQVPWGKWAGRVQAFAGRGVGRVPLL